MPRARAGAPLLRRPGRPCRWSRRCRPSLGRSPRVARSTAAWGGVAASVQSSGDVDRDGGLAVSDRHRGLALLRTAAGRGDSAQERSTLGPCRRNEELRDTKTTEFERQPFGGGGGIRTHGPLARATVFKTSRVWLSYATSQALATVRATVGHESALFPARDRLSPLKPARGRWEMSQDSLVSANAGVLRANTAFFDGQIILSGLCPPIQRPRAARTPPAPSARCKLGARRPRSRGVDRRAVPGSGIGFPSSRAAASHAAFALSAEASASSGDPPNAEQASRSGMSAM